MRKKRKMTTSGNRSTILFDFVEKAKFNNRSVGPVLEIDSCGYSWLKKSDVKRLRDILDGCLNEWIK